MIKIVEEKNGHDYIAVNEQMKIGPEKSLTFIKRKGLANDLGPILMKIFYLIIGISGLTGALFIIIGEIENNPVLGNNMVLTFGVACTLLAVMHVGFSGFYELVKDSDKSLIRQVRNSGNA